MCTYDQQFLLEKFSNDLYFSAMKESFKNVSVSQWTSLKSGLRDFIKFLLFSSPANPDSDESTVFPWKQAKKSVLSAGLLLRSNNNFCCSEHAAAGRKAERPVGSAGQAQWAATRLGLIDLASSLRPLVAFTSSSGWSCCFWGRKAGRRLLSF